MLKAFSLGIAAVMLLSVAQVAGLDEVKDEEEIYVVLVAPKRNSKEVAFVNDIKDMRNYLLNHGVDDEHICFLAPDGAFFVDGDATNANMIAALEEVANLADGNDVVYIEFADHGAGYWAESLGGDGANHGGRIDSSTVDPNPDDEDDAIYAVQESGKPYDEAICTYDPSHGFDSTDYLYDDEIAELVDSINAGTIILTVGSCFSGGFIDDCKADGRIVLTASMEEEVGWYWPNQHMIFLYNFHQGLFDGMSIEGAYEYAVNVDDSDEHPQMHDGVPGEFYLGKTVRGMSVEVYTIEPTAEPESMLNSWGL